MQEQPSRAPATTNRAAPPPETIRVAHLLDGRHFGGAEQMVRLLIQASPAAGIEAWAYCLSEGRLADFLRAEGLPLRVFRASGRFDFRMLPGLARAARRDGIQLLQGHTSRAHLLARILSRRLSIPNVTTIQSPIAMDENRAAGRHPLRAWVERVGRRWTDHIVPVSREETERIIREEHVPRDRITWIPNGIAPATPAMLEARREAFARRLEREGRVRPPLVAAMIAQFRPRKGPETLLRAFARWKQDGGRGLLFMIGDDEFTEGGGYLASLKALAGSLGIANEACFTGFLENPWELAAGADLFVLPSLFGEGLPLSILEAMNHGLAVAASAIAGNRELVEPGRTGWLHPPGDDRALTEHLAEAATDMHQTRRFGRAGRERFLAQFTLDEALRRYRALYEVILRKKN